MSVARDPQPGRGARRAAWALLIASTAALLLLFDDFGLTWDAAVQARYGDLALDYFLSAGSDTRVNEFLDLRHYGPLFEMLLAAAARLTGAQSIELRHLLIGISALLTVAATGLLGRRFGDPLIPPFAMLALIAMPRFVGHAFNNSKDVPLACAFAWSVMAALHLLDSRKRGPAALLFLGLAAGSAMAIRSGAVMLFGVVGAAAVVYRWRSTDTAGARLRSIGRDGARLALALLLAWLLMVLCWPSAHEAPLTHPLASLAEAGDFSARYTVMFAGSPVNSGSLPRSYLLHYLAIVTPPAILMLAVAGLLLAAIEGFTRRHADRSFSSLTLLLWIALPVGGVVLARPNLYDGIRHFLFLLPALALACALAAAWIVRRAASGWRTAAATALTLLIAAPLVSAARLHPYQSSYFNFFVGGVAGAASDYDVDYWASSYREASLWVRARLDESATVAVACNGHNRAIASYYLERPGDRPRQRVHCVWDGSEGLPADVPYFIGMRRFGKASTFYPDWPVAHRVERGGAWFSLVKSNPRFTDGDRGR